MAYKVVTPKLGSCLHSKHGVRVQYKENEFVAPIYPPFVFKCVGEARRWALEQCGTRHIDYQIWRCRTKDLRQARAILPLNKVMGLLDRFWQSILEEEELGGTILLSTVHLLSSASEFRIADKVMLTKRVA